MLQLQSFSRVMLVMLTTPLDISGVAAAPLILDRPFGFVALMGFTALLGLIMRNSVLLIDLIGQDRARSGHLRRHRRIDRPSVPPRRFDSGSSHFGDDSNSPQRVLGPMAVAIMGGLIETTALTLFAFLGTDAASLRVRREPAPAA